MNTFNNKSGGPTILGSQLKTILPWYIISPYLHITCWAISNYHVVKWNQFKFQFLNTHHQYNLSFVPHAFTESILKQSTSSTVCPHVWRGTWWSSILHHMGYMYRVLGIHKLHTDVAQAFLRMGLELSDSWGHQDTMLALPQVE